jgi:carboxyl-terminal processing protease
MKRLERFMKRNYKIVIPLVLLAGILLSFQIKKQADPEKDKILIGLIRYALTQGHYEPRNLDDTFSEAVYADFIDGLDPTKRFFTQEDLDQFSFYKDKIDDQIKSEDLTFYNNVYSRFARRLREARNFYPEILKTPFDFGKDETLNVDYDLKPYAKNEAELIQNWRKQLKLNTLARLYNKFEIEEDKKKEDSTYVIKSFKQLEEESRVATMKSTKDFFNFMDDLDDTDWFSVFINSISESFDPHTSYFAPKVKKSFYQELTGKLEGIGARLQKKEDYTTVVELVSGGPAWRAGELEVGDIILKVAQGDEEPLDIIGMRLDDAIEFIKGKKGTEVRLTVKKIDGSTKIISIIRDVVELEETFAKTSVVKKDGRTFGLINLPKFYIDFSEQNFRNSATDMAKEVERMKAQNVEGLIIDLRNNGGGSLETAIDIAGLFIEEGPIVQVKYKESNPKIRNDKDIKIRWDKPLVVLVNEQSASASEIFAAAMQDYKRAVIIGSKQTFGKGTVQNILPLNNYYKYDKDLGALKMTIQKFYRINGGSTQLEGVLSDVAMPNRYSYFDIGERDYSNPLPWDKIEKATYKTWDKYQNFDDAVNNSKKRIAKNSQFLLIDKNARWLKEGRDDTTIYLNFNDYKNDLEKRENEAKDFQSIYDYQSNLTFESPLYEQSLIVKDSILAQKRKVWHKNLSKDIYVEEALNVLAELKIKQPHLKLVKN